MEASDVPLRGHGSNQELAAISAPIATLKEGIIFNGLGEAGHETFYFCEHEGDRVKTARKPYDRAVSCILLRAFALCPRNIKICSDGYWDEYIWENARELYRSLWPNECIQCPWDDETDDSDDPSYREMRNHQSRVIRQGQSETNAGIHSLRASPISTVSMVQFEAIRDWISNCASSCDHGKCRPKSMTWRKFPGIRFRLIDVRQRCVVSALDDWPFAVLSYVWGDVDQVKLTTANSQELSRPHGLDSVWQQIPTTVRDAILVCERLGEDYLWVDALCIMQDSARDRTIQILRMRSIYSAAKFTIVAASTKTADEGLLTKQPSAVVPTLCSSIEDLEAVLAISPWGSRGWCYQEQALSHRAILFSSNGIFLQCQEATHDLQGTQLAKSRSTSPVSQSQKVGGLLNIPQGQNLEYFLSAVEHYSKRKFTLGKDKVSAFQGVFHTLEGMMDGERSTFHFGLPTCAFDQTVCWRAAQHGPHLRNQNFPSWSWLGWDNEVSFERSLVDLTRTSHMLEGVRYQKLLHRLEPRPACRLRKTIKWPSTNDHGSFGFPVSIDTTTGYSWPKLALATSSAYLRISARAQQIRGSNGLYNVFPTTCRKSMPLQGLKPTTHPSQGDAPRSAPLDPTIDEASKQYGISDHEHHEDCGAEVPLGDIWLDITWRDHQPRVHVMKFIALSGYLDSQRTGRWYITILMCLLVMDVTSENSDYERFQIMECSISENCWLEFGGFYDLVSIR
ncbi:hypothetical protein CORC01_03695 [Colletotrichum orchidophilum]|uniref:Heterokaryon incompatibility domain-containing protein n=1 Tax=Colletotrichum orchidophilum TaxID=1209926 RepID=A0A1G4BHW8_9PEZI|nr:uncharacterized protein CORC01_03695 [Colletotrichum orchidophilum]OHF00867.1 hypothetical protein CORC01_03695 [Colletotrichum orchidophilum]